MTAINLPAKENQFAPEAEVLPPEETHLVNKFIDRSQTIIPGLQVTLAKRVVVPGSRRVLCMAAHTSVPISDNELSSVSELALRLSDGTSCLLSLKFFNDTMDSGFVNANPFIYDPERYEAVHGQSNLGVAILAVAFVAITGYYYAISQTMMANIRGNQTAAVHKSASHSAITSSKGVPASATVLKSVDAEAKIAPAKTTTAKTSLAKASSVHRSYSHIKAINNEYAEPMRASAFVPPPPPMAVAPMPYNPAMSYPFYMPNNTQPIVKKSSAERSVSKPVVKEATPSTPQRIERIEPSAERVPVKEEVSSAEAAPTPGELHLERIVIPNQ